MAKKGFFSRLFGADGEGAEDASVAKPAGKEAELPKDEDPALEAVSETEQGDNAEDVGASVVEADESASAITEAETEEKASSDATSVDVEPSEDDGINDEVLGSIEPEEAAVLQDAPAENAEPTPDLVSNSEESTAPEQKLSWFERLKQGLSRSSGALGEGISSIFTKRKLDDDTLQDLEDILIQADLGVETAMTITERLAENRYNKEVSDGEVQEILSEEVDRVLEPVAVPLSVGREDGSPHVILMIGVNGAGKTTTIGKLAQKFKADGKSVMLAAGDTFRAAAIDQLKVWGERTGAPVIARDVGADAAGLAFDAMQEAKEQGKDVLLIDTAGRLQNRTELMAELEKIVRVIKKHDPEAPHSVLLVLDATTGQNALNQVEVFSKMAGVTGLVMTKLDGTARGGILVAISAKHKLPVHFIGVGERVEDLEPFKSQEFARAIAGLTDA